MRRLVVDNKPPVVLLFGSISSLPLSNLNIIEDEGGTEIIGLQCERDVFMRSTLRGAHRNAHEEVHGTSKIQDRIFISSGTSANRFSGI